MINIGEVLLDLWNSSGFAAMSAGFASGGWQNLVMLIIGCVLLYLGIVKQFEPLLMCGIAFGCVLTNLPMGGLYHQELWTAFMDPESPMYHSFGAIMREGGLLDITYIGVKTSLYPCLIFMGVGAMTDFGPLLSNPKSLLLGAAAQLGVFVAFFGGVLLGFTGPEAASIGIIGGADGPTAIFLTTKLAPHLLGAIAVAAYSYMALIPLIQPPIRKVEPTMVAPTDRDSRMVTMFIRAFCMVSDRRSVRPVSLHRLPNIRQPIRAAVSGSSRATKIVTRMGKMIFSALDTVRV